MTELRIKNKNGSSRIKMEIIKMLKNKNYYYCFRISLLELYFKDNVTIIEIQISISYHRIFNCT